VVDDLINVIDMPNHTDLSLRASIVCSARIDANNAIDRLVGGATQLLDSRTSLDQLRSRTGAADIPGREAVSINQELA
jgi:hypothetical protein